MKKIDAVPNSFLDTAVIRFALMQCVLLLLLFFSFANHAFAADSAGVILSVIGKVEILRGAETIVPDKRTELNSGDTIVTGVGRVQIRFADGTMLTLYNDTKFAVDEYRYDKGKNDRARFSLLSGLMHTLTGHIDKRNYLLKTRLATLGVRGTEYSVNLTNTLHVSVDQGRVELANAGGTILVGAGQSVIVTGANAMPKPSTGGKLDLRRLGIGPGKPGGAGGPGGPGGGAGAAPPPPPPGAQQLSRTGGQQNQGGQLPPPP